MDLSLSSARYRHVIFTAPTWGRRRRATTDRVDARPELLVAPACDKEAFLRSLFYHAGLNLHAYRLETLIRRVPACLRALRCTSIDRARSLVRQKPALLKVALNALLIGVTGFFRDRQVFDALRDRFIPGITRTPRVWSAACSDGSELYSVAMLLAEAGLLIGADLLGTDCRPDALDAARAGSYSADALRDVPADLLTRHFRADGPHWSVVPALNAATRWRAGDALRVIEPGEWDMILCRNMAMYLRPDAARRLWHGLSGALRPGGLLVLGKAERPDGASTLSPVAPCIFRRDRG